MHSLYSSGLSEKILFKPRRLGTVCWANYSRLERAWFIMWLIKLPKFYNTKFVIQMSVFIITFKTALRVSALFPAITKYCLLRNIIIFH
jgi:hypothetical protein